MFCQHTIYEDLKGIIEDSVRPEERGLSTAEVQNLAESIEDRFLERFLRRVIDEVEDIMAISPLLPWPEILVACAEKIVKALGADAASIRLYDQDTNRMVSCGSYNFPDRGEPGDVCRDGSVCGLVVQSGKSYYVSNLLLHPFYQNKEAVRHLGLNSLLAVPVHTPRLLDGETDRSASLQIYYREQDRQFKPLEILHAEILARRVSHVLAQKRIIDLSRLNQQKEKLVEAIFSKLSNREGIKTKEMFQLMIPELINIIQVQRCALFSVSPDRKTVWPEATYPVQQRHESISDILSTEVLSYLHDLLSGTASKEDSEIERIDPNYQLIKEPKSLPFISTMLFNLTEEDNLHSILFVPLRTQKICNHFMVFCATEQRKAFTDEEIELFTFFGKEVMKALRMERMDDILHDFKNPVVAVGGFARRARRLLEQGDGASIRDQIKDVLDIVVRETDRMEEIAVNGSIEGRQRSVDAGEVLKRRFALNAEAMNRLGYRKALLDMSEIDAGLFIHSAPLEYERVLDNLLSNATQAIPFQGGFLKASCNKKGPEVVLTIKNSGRIRDDQIEGIRNGTTTGRGLNIVSRFVEEIGGRMEVQTEGEATVIVLYLPCQG